MSSQLVIRGRSVPAEVLICSLGYLQRADLCHLQRVSRLFREIIDSGLPVYPTCTPCGKRFHLVVTTESSDVPIYSPIRYRPECAFSRFNQEFLFPHMSLAESPQPIPAYIDIQDLTLIYGRLLNVDQLCPLPLPPQWLDLGHSFRKWNKEEHAWNRPTTFTLQYSRHHDHTEENQIALSGEALEFVLSRTVIAGSIIINVVDLPRISGSEKLLSFLAFRYSSAIDLNVEGKCEHKLLVADVLDYVMGRRYIPEPEEVDFDPVRGRNIKLTVNVLENGDQDIHMLSTEIIRRFMDLRSRQFFDIVIVGCKKPGLPKQTTQWSVDGYPVHHTARYNPRIESSLLIEYRRRRNKDGRRSKLQIRPLMVNRRGQLSCVGYY